MAANIPHPSSFTDSFGAGQLPEGLGRLLRRLWQSVRPEEVFGLFLAVYAILAVGVALAVRTLGWNAEFRRTLRALTVREELCLLVGSLLTCGCFFAGLSVGYREIDLLLVIPSLLALRRLAPPKLWPLRIASVLAVFLLWCAVPQQAVYFRYGGRPYDGGRLPTVVFWLGRELAWWLLIAILLATIVAACVNDLQSRRFGRCGCRASRV